MTDLSNWSLLIDALERELPHCEHTIHRIVRIRDLFSRVEQEVMGLIEESLLLPYRGGPLQRNEENSMRPAHVSFKNIDTDLAEKDKLDSSGGVLLESPRRTVSGFIGGLGSYANSPVDDAPSRYPTLSSGGILPGASSSSTGVSHYPPNSDPYAENRLLANSTTAGSSKTGISDTSTASNKPSGISAAPGLGFGSAVATMTSQPSSSPQFSALSAAKDVSSTTVSSYPHAVISSSPPAIVTVSGMESGVERTTSLHSKPSSSRLTNQSQNIQESSSFVNEMMRMSVHGTTEMNGRRNWLLHTVSSSHSDILSCATESVGTSGIVVTGSFDHSIVVSEVLSEKSSSLESYQPRAIFHDHRGAVTALCARKVNGKHLIVSGSGDSYIVVHQASQISDFDSPGESLGQSAEGSFAFPPDGNLSRSQSNLDLYGESDLSTEALMLFERPLSKRLSGVFNDLPNGYFVHSALGNIECNSEYINSLSWSWDGDLCQGLVAGFRSGLMQLQYFDPAFDFRSGVRVWRGHDQSITSLSSAPDHSALFTSVCEAGMLRMWDIRSLSSPVIEHHAHSDACRGVSFEAFGSNFVFSAADDRRIRRWDIRHLNAPVHEYTFPSSVNCFDLSPRHGYIVCGLDGGGVFVVEPSTLKLVAEIASDSSTLSMITAVSWIGTEGDLLFSNCVGFTRLALFSRGSASKQMAD